MADLAFGLRADLRESCPEGAAIWGARWIWPNDLVYDRQDMVGSDEERTRLLGWLNASAPAAPTPLGAAMVQAKTLALTYELSPADVRVVTLFEDDLGIIQASPQGSHGYLYVAAWLKDSQR